jgi:hypothetical protein
MGFTMKTRDIQGTTDDSLCLWQHVLSTTWERLDLAYLCVISDF